MIRLVILAAALAACSPAHGEREHAPVAKPIDAAPSVPADAEAAPSVVLEVEGTVERAVDGHWVQVHAGDELSEQDMLRTGDGARAKLDVGAIVVLDDRTELTVREISASLAELALTAGHVRANASDGATIRISTRDTDAVAETAAGSFDVLDSGTGQVTVAAATGAVKVTAGGSSIEVPAGMESVVRAGGVASAPVPIPPSLFLKVRVAQTERAVQGTTTPGAVVSVDGVRTATDPRGGFTLPLPVGDHRIVVLVEDASGRRERRLLARPPAVPGAADEPRLDAKVTW